MSSSGKQPKRKCREKPADSDDDAIEDEGSFDSESEERSDDSTYLPEKKRRQLAAERRRFNKRSKESVPCTIDLTQDDSSDDCDGVNDDGTRHATDDYDDDYDDAVAITQQDEEEQDSLSSVAALSVNRPLRREDNGKDEDIDQDGEEGGGSNGKDTPHEDQREIPSEIEPSPQEQDQLRAPGVAQKNDTNTQHEDDDGLSYSSVPSSSRSSESSGAATQPPEMYQPTMVSSDTNSIQTQDQPAPEMSRQNLYKRSARVPHCLHFPPVDNINIDHQYKDDLASTLSGP